MKASLKLREERESPLVRAKVPISVLGFPFVSSASAGGDPSDLSFHIRSGAFGGDGGGSPSVKLSYHPNDSLRPFILSVKFGVGGVGSEGSPLLMSADFSLVGRASPSFQLQIKPRLGDFSLKKTIVSSTTTATNNNPNPNQPIKENGEVHRVDGLDRPLPWRNWTEFHGRDSPLTGFVATARTSLPLTKRAALKLRWGLNFPSELGRDSLPFLTLDKISVESLFAEEVKGPSKLVPGDLEVLKGMCVWMGREVEELRKENLTMKEKMEQLRCQVPLKGLKKLPGIEGSEESMYRRREVKTGGDVEEELKKALKAGSPSILA
ncbi:hypothetical protein QJS10_CPA10g01125 [Acorus calamus]|uniref:Uncharacterized protein n=1 Tax=Acorus calamus TaxID=4465 RepID=A0AAV9E0I9_ACOCL|nr:hypothetical protein QJS10_CPA10g01125 [Acorus calamus]